MSCMCAVQLKLGMTFKEEYWICVRLSRVCMRSFADGIDPRATILAGTETPVMDESGSCLLFIKSYSEVPDRSDLLIPIC